MESKQAVSYFIRIYHRNSFNVYTLILDNSQTNEKLVIKRAHHNLFYVTVSRYPVVASKEWIEGMSVKPDCYDEYRKILIDI